MANYEDIKKANESIKTLAIEHKDKDGNITITSAKATVTFNESKRAAQLAAVKSIADLQKLMKILQV